VAATATTTLVIAALTDPNKTMIVEFPLVRRRRRWGEPQ
jgi:hypothetical protein